MIDSDGNNGYISLNAYLRLRDRKGVYSNFFGCGRTENGVVQCGIDCDGGTFLVRPSSGSLLIENQGFVVVGGCGASDEDQENLVEVLPGADDKTFRLDKQPLDQCTALREAMLPTWAKPARRCANASPGPGRSASHANTMPRISPRIRNRPSSASRCLKPPRMASRTIRRNTIWRSASN